MTDAGPSGDAGRGVEHADEHADTRHDDAHADAQHDDAHADAQHAAQHGDTRPSDEHGDAQHGDAGRVRQVVIVGAGFSGIGMAIKLKEAGEHDVVIVEKAADLGGTWRDNTYPGCACDIPSDLYSFSFRQHPGWTRHYPRQQEIWDYLRACADEYGVTPHIRFGAELASAEFDDDERVWTVTLRTGDVLRARVLISGMGALHVPSYPDLPGLDAFTGPAFHSARWDHDVDLTGKRVAVIGTGASAVQFVPQLAKTAAHVSVFQRTPPWILPKADRRVGARERALLRRLPALQRLRRAWIYWTHELRVLGMVLNPKLMTLAEKVGRAHLAKQVPDRELRRALTPDYTMGCKRVLISNDYYPALGQEHVDLVTEKITEVRAGAVVTADGTEHAADVLIHGTGFHVIDALAGIPITGAGGVALADAWADGVEAYDGATVAGFPNFFLLLGPNTGLGHNSIVFVIEAQVRYVLRCLDVLRAAGPGATMAPTAAAQRRYNDGLQRRLEHTVWGSGCDSWYLDDDGRNRTIWPGFTFSYWLRTRRPRLRDYRVTPGTAAIAGRTTDPAVSAAGRRADEVSA